MENKACDISKITVQEFAGVGIVQNEGVEGYTTFALSIDGLLHVINKTRKIEKWMNIKVEKAHGMRVSENMILCSCSDGIVRIFDSNTLQHIQTLPKPPPLGKANWLVGEKIVKVQNKDSVKYADAVALRLDANR